MSRARRTLVPARLKPTSAGAIPPARDFLGRRFAVKGPLVGWIVFERIGGLLAYLFAHARVAPTFVTVLGGISGIAGAVLLADAHDLPTLLIAGAVLLLSYSLDCADGQLARATRRTSGWGAWLDVATDSLVTVFMAAAVTVALLANGGSPSNALLLAGAYGASRVVSLVTVSQIRSSSAGGLSLSGPCALLRTAYVAVTDTPVTYLALCAARLSPPWFTWAVAIVTIMTVGQTLVSVRHHFRSARSQRDDHVDRVELYTTRTVRS